MDKLDQINFNISEFFKDIVAFVQKVWEYIEKFFAEGATNPFVNEETT